MSTPRGGTPEDQRAGDEGSTYQIEARSLSVAGVAGHNYWVLRGPDGSAVAELHGLATDRETGRAIPIGTDPDKHSLRIWHYVHDEGFAAAHGVRTTRATYIADGQPSRMVVSGSSEDVLERWNAAVSAMAPLNAKDLDYPSYGFKVFGDTVNSNSAYRTLGEIMGVPVRDFPGRVEPGIDNRMISPEAIKELRTHALPTVAESRYGVGEDDQLTAGPTRNAHMVSESLFAGAKGGDDALAGALRDLKAGERGQTVQSRCRCTASAPSRAGAVAGREYHRGRAVARLTSGERSGCDCHFRWRRARRAFPRIWSGHPRRRRSRVLPPDGCQGPWDLGLETAFVSLPFFKQCQHRAELGLLAGPM